MLPELSIYVDLVVVEVMVVVVAATVKYQHSNSKVMVKIMMTTAMEVKTIER